ncbi:MAG TPA: NAD-dependent epimerase/dehydratase family protein [Desulfobacteraceae bacterium]|nr:MAG: sugar dehydratase [Deltaproteobacteria bacterium]HDL07714.1 NAD-dependent epimerase/dehydratase family protein [Desulfobacteraceae bacterium]
MKNILVIGGSYFLGKVFVEELAKEKDYSIHVLNRGNRPLKMDGVNEIVCDRQNAALLKTRIPFLNFDAVVDFCAYTPDDIQIILSVIPENSIKQYVYISTSSVYQDVLDLPIKENAPKLTGPQPELGPYAEYAFNKWKTEEKLMTLCSKTGIFYTSLRPVIIYGKYNYAPRESYFFDLILNNKTVILPDNPLPLFSFVSVWDVAKIIMQCIGNEKVCNRAFNLSGEEMISYKRLIEVFRKVTGKKIATKKMNSKKIDQMRIPLPFPLDNHLIYSGTLIKDVLNFHYAPFEDEMKKTYQFYIGKNSF